MSSPDNPSRRPAGSAWLFIGCLTIVVLQVVVAWAGDTRAFSGSDAGGRAASVAAAAEAGGCDHDLGYWAEEWDPSGRAHPMVNSVATDNGYFQPTALPYVCAASVAADALGLPWALWVSVLGVVFAAVGAWMLERSAGGDGTGSFVLVGVVGPIAFYGTDTWEHAPAAGAAVLGTALLLASTRRETAVVGGLLWGMAVSMRTETAIVAVGLVVGVLLIGAVRRSVLADTVRLVLFGMAGGVVPVLDRLAQQELAGFDYRGDRVSTQAGDVAVDLADRTRDALVTTVGLFATNPPWSGIAIGVGLVLCLAILGLQVTGSQISPMLVTASVVGLGALVVIRVVDPGFVPGVLTAAPLAVVGVFALRRGSVPIVRTLAIAALVTLPVVWLFQWRGNLGPQWGGRYALVSGALLTVCGVVVARPRWSSLAVRSVVVASVVLGLSGFAWHVERTRTFAAGIEDILELPCDDVFISTSTYLVREGGAFEEMRTGVRDDGCRMLNGGDGRLQLALEVAVESGADRVTLLAAGRVETDPESLSATTIVDREFIEIADSVHTLFFLALPEA